MLCVLIRYPATNSFFIINKKQIFFKKAKTADSSKIFLYLPCK
ncbi:MAG: sortase B protein-sorting domain-containing protein [Selenomonadaceae bacterium]|nr:sortase B protein-sorting domain-containing protein [Selenomonadaceae bacterium]MBR6905656.1 sortase B protein-sorting domain-containing protein [Selenomonadaceae bacterium]